MTQLLIVTSPDMVAWYSRIFFAKLKTSARVATLFGDQEYFTPAPISCLVVQDNVSPKLYI